ncbi:hypothetical protein HBN50_09080 [Halobacteriovorax sp. GB3]|uniref:endonuclease/exonuclease/phosphatase family protein n=1 Tax=Halobacteriovorax sp. GB3 TaxID=2719615 RepID=UPI00235DD9D1|nr:endonuclease/exonuclease/phosphatase family protein [Halobacteriovorax sp. GB3]MDD0853250.1 hypothetical protein [Halobacteriovorax sp. GB3]
MKELKTCTFNLENFFLVQTEHVENPLAYKSLDKIKWIANVIEEIDADIYLLTEVGTEDSLHYFNDKYLDSKYHVSVIRGNTNRGIEIGFLINKRLPFHYSHFTYKNHSLGFKYENTEEDGPFEKMSRDIAELHIKDPKTEEVLFICLLVHLKSKLDKDGIDPEGNYRREAEANLLAKAYKKLEEQFPKVPKLIAGDFNNTLSDSTNWELQALRDLEMKDILELLDLPDHMKATHVHFPHQEPAKFYQLDYILLHPLLWNRINPEQSGVYRYKDQHGNRMGLPTEHYHRYGLPSDHYPVVATFSWKL